MRKQVNSIDRYSLVPAAISKNPFMTKLMKSSEFNPVQGVTHYEKANDLNSPKVSGGEWKHPDINILSRKEFEHRRTFTNLREVGPA